MFALFGGHNPPPDSDDDDGQEGVLAERAAEYERVLLEKDEQIRDLQSKCIALSDALHQDEVDEFGVAIATKNKVLENEFQDAIEVKNRVLEEQCRQIDSLIAENELMKRRLDGDTQGLPPSGNVHVAAEGPPAPSPITLVSASQEPLVDVSSTSSLEMQLEASRQEAGHLLQTMQEQAMQVEQAQKTLTENGELRWRLTDAIGRFAEAQRRLHPEMVKEFVLVLGEGEAPLGVIFAPSETRVLAGGWPVKRVRDGSWGASQGLQEGDELHSINGSCVEVLPEDEVLQLLNARPLELLWKRRTGEEVATTSEVVTASNVATPENSKPSTWQQDFDAATKERNDAIEELAQLRTVEALLQKELSTANENLRDSMNEVAKLRSEALAVANTGQPSPDLQEVEFLRKELQVVADERAKEQQHAVAHCEHLQHNYDAAMVDLRDARDMISDLRSQKVVSSVEGVPGAEDELRRQLEEEQARVAEAESEISHLSNMVTAADEQARIMQDELDRARAEATSTPTTAADYSRVCQDLDDCRRLLLEEQAKTKEKEADVTRLQDLLKVMQDTGMGMPSAAPSAQAPVAVQSQVSEDPSGELEDDGWDF